MKYITLEDRNRVGILTMRKEITLNALDTELLEEFNDTLRSIDCERLRALIITGYGKSFCAGADITSMAEMTSAEAVKWSDHGNAVCNFLTALPIPTIAAVNGYAFGGGFELALSCDLRTASQSALFALPETSLGIIPGFGGTQRLARIAGISEAKSLIFTGAKINAEDAYNKGIVNSVWDGNSLIENTLKIALQIAKNAPIAIKQAKKAIDSGYELPHLEGISLETDCFSFCFTTEDQRRGMQSFLNREKNVEFFHH